MSRSLQILLPPMALMLGCGGHEHTFHRVDDPIPPQVVPATLRVDLAFQENDWGERTTRCQMQVAFEPLPEFSDPNSPDGPEEEGSSTDPGEPGPSAPDPIPLVAVPSAPGECAFSAIPPAPPPPPPPPHHSGGPPEPASETDNWQLSGAVIGPDSIELWGLDDAWTLDTVETDHGGLRYEWIDCGLDDYPFSTTLTMDVPASSDPDGVHPFTMEDLVPVGPRVLLDEPAPFDNGQPYIFVEEPLVVAWHTSGRLPEVNGQVQPAETLVKLQTHDRERLEETRWLVCWPEEDGWMELSPDELAPLFVDRTDSDHYATHIDVHMQLLGEERPTPWGEALTVRTNTSSGAGLRARSVDGPEDPPPPPPP